MNKSELIEKTIFAAKNNFDYEFYRGDELIAVCTNVHTANHLMMLELKKVKR